MKQPAVYIMASRRNGTIYTGVTSDLARRAWQHRTGAISGFTGKHRCALLVWFEVHETMPDAIAREKQLKAGRRARKLALIEAENPTWHDLYPELFGSDEAASQSVQDRRPTTLDCRARFAGSQ